MPDDEDRIPDAGADGQGGQPPETPEGQEEHPESPQVVPKEQYDEMRSMQDRRFNELSGRFKELESKLEQATARRDPPPPPNGDSWDKVQALRDAGQEDQAVRMTARLSAREVVAPLEERTKQAEQRASVAETEVRRIRLKEKIPDLDDLAPDMDDIFAQNREGKLSTDEVVADAARYRRLQAAKGKGGPAPPPKLPGGAPPAKDKPPDKKPNPSAAPPYRSLDNG